MLAAFLGLSGKGQLILGIGVAAAALLMFSPSLRAKLSSLLDKFLKTSPSPVPPPSNPDSPSVLPISSNLQVHEAVSNLIAYFVAQRDEKGVMLSGAVGQHIYAKGIDLAAKSTMPVGPGSVDEPGPHSFIPAGS